MSDIFNGNILILLVFHHVYVRPADANIQNAHREGLGQSDHLLQTLLPDWIHLFLKENIWWLGCGLFTKMGKKSQNRPKNVFFCPQAKKYLHYQSLRKKITSDLSRGPPQTEANTWLTCCSYWGKRCLRALGRLFTCIPMENNLNHGCATNPLKYYRRY